MRIDGTARLSGPLMTFVDYFGYVSYDPVNRKIVGATWDHHTGSLRGCSSGSFVLHQTDIQGDPTTFNAATGTFGLTLRWTILPGSGTGASTCPAGNRRR